MNNLSRYNGEIDMFDFNIEELRKAGIELNVLRCEGHSNPSSELVIDLLVIKALRDYFRREKIISFNAMECYLGALKKSSKLVDKIRLNGYFLPFPINPDKFNQEEILNLYQKEKFNPLLGMMAFVERGYERKFNS